MESNNGWYDQREPRHEKNDKFSSNGSETSSRVDHDKPPFSRLFVVCSKQHTAPELKTKFDPYGTVEDVWVVKDKHTKENKGIAYVKYSKMSEACMAVENLDKVKVNEDDEYPLKVLVSQPKSSQSSEGFSDDTALTRLFLVLPKTIEDDQLKEIAQEYGTVDYVQIVKNRNTGEHKGFGYIKYDRAYDAALALENLDRSYKAVMATPKGDKVKREIKRESNSTTGFNFGSANRQTSVGSLDGQRNQYQPIGYADQGNMNLRSTGAIGNRLQVNCATHITADQLCSLFDLIPGLELCDLKKNFATGESKGLAIVVYNSVGSAIYAKEKLNGFEYPLGYKLAVRYAPEDEDGFANELPAGVVPGFGGGGSTFCSAQLPPVRPLADSDTCECVERLFVVCQPTPPPTNALIDTFCRFGDLIDVFMLKEKNFGYAKYASAEAAAEAMKALHGVEVCGKKLKVLAAEPPKTAESARKRPRT